MNPSQHVASDDDNDDDDDDGVADRKEKSVAGYIEVGACCFKFDRIF